MVCLGGCKEFGTARGIDASTNAEMGGDGSALRSRGSGTPEVLRLLNEPGVERLVLSDTDLNDIDWSIVKAPPSLKRVVLERAHISRRVVSWIARHPSITGISVLDCVSFRDLLLAIELQQRIRFLTLQEVDLEDDDVSNLMNFSQLRSLSLANSTLSDQQLLRVAEVTSLEDLNILHTPVSVSAMWSVRKRRPTLILYADEWRAFEE